MKRVCFACGGPHPWVKGDASLSTCPGKRCFFCSTAHSAKNAHLAVDCPKMPVDSKVYEKAEDQAKKILASNPPKQPQQQQQQQQQSSKKKKNKNNNNNSNDNNNDSSVNAINSNNGGAPKKGGILDMDPQKLNEFLLLAMKVVSDGARKKKEKPAEAESDN